MTHLHHGNLRWLAHADQRISAIAATLQRKLANTAAALEASHTLSRSACAALELLIAAQEGDRQALEDVYKNEATPAGRAGERAA